jgi:hypothetical protein
LMIAMLHPHTNISPFVAPFVAVMSREDPRDFSDLMRFKGWTRGKFRSLLRK